MIAFKLLSIEWFKTRHRFIFWAALLGFAGLLSIMLGGSQYMHARNPRNSAFTLPRDWPQVTGAGELAVVLVIVTLALLIASERTWRTQRQNVIDGLSRAQFFGGKVLLSLLVVALYFVLPVIAALIFAIFDGAPGYTDGSGPFLPRLTQLLLTGYFLNLLVTGMLALLFAILASSSGAALALTLVFTALQAPVAMLIARYAEPLIPLVRRLPLFVTQQLSQPQLYDEAKRMAMNARLKPGLGQLSALLHPLEAQLLALGWAVAFIAFAWLAFRHRDL